MPTDQVQTDHHFIVRSGVRSFRLDNGRIDITSAIDGGIYTYRRARFGHDALITRNQQLILSIKRGLIVRRQETELCTADGELSARAREGNTLEISPVAGAAFRIEPADLSRAPARDSRFLYADAEVQGEACGRLDKQNWLKASLEVKLPGRIPKGVALFAAWWMWRRWERAKALA